MKSTGKRINVFGTNLVMLSICFSSRLRTDSISEGGIGSDIKRLEIASHFIPELVALTQQN